MKRGRARARAATGGPGCGVGGRGFARAVWRGLGGRLGGAERHGKGRLRGSDGAEGGAGRRDWVGVKGELSLASPNPLWGFGLARDSLGRFFWRVGDEGWGCEGAAGRRWRGWGAWAGEGVGWGGVGWGGGARAEEAGFKRGSRIPLGDSGWREIAVGRVFWTVGEGERFGAARGSGAAGALEGLGADPGRPPRAGAAVGRAGEQRTLGQLREQGRAWPMPGKEAGYETGYERWGTSGGGAEGVSGEGERSGEGGEVRMAGSGDARGAGSGYEDVSSVP